MGIRVYKSNVLRVYEEIYFNWLDCWCDFMFDYIFFVWECLVNKMLIEMIRWMEEKKMKCFVWMGIDVGGMYMKVVVIDNVIYEIIGKFLVKMIYDDVCGVVVGVV